MKYYLHNRNSTLGENVRYFMHKYNIVFTDWFENINILYNKIDMYVQWRIQGGPGVCPPPPLEMLKV